MSPTSHFGVGFVATPDFVPFAAAAVSSLRRYNATVPVTVAVDQPSADLDRVASRLAMSVERIPTSVDDLWAASPAERQSASSRIVKIEALVRTSNDPHLYLDSDIVLLGDVGEIEPELAPLLGSDADLFMLLNRPVAPTFWGDRHNYLRDPNVDRDAATRLINETYQLTLPSTAIDELVCWNSGVIYGSADALHILADRWLTLYRRMLVAPTRDQVIPRDQLSFWLTLWELRHTLRVKELPRRWNFMAGHFLGLDVGTPDVEANRLDGVRVLHLAQNKFDPWALREVESALAGLGFATPESPAVSR